MSSTLTEGYDILNGRQHGSVKEYPFLISLFPDLYVNAAGAFAASPFQLTLAAGTEVTVPFVLPKDGIFRESIFRYDVTDGNYSCMLSDVSIALFLLSGGNRVVTELVPLGLFQGTNNGWGQVRVPYIHPKEGSVAFRFRNRYPGTRAISGWLAGYKVAA